MKTLRKADLNNIVYGKLPPQATELESAVLGVILMERERLDDVVEILPTEEFFYKDEHQKIYKAVLSLIKQGKAVDVGTVTTELGRQGELEAVGGAYGLMLICDSISNSANVLDHARIVAEKYILRKTIIVCGGAISEAYNQEDCFEVLNKTVVALSEIYDGQEDSTVHISRATKESLERIEQAMANPGRLRGVPTGFKELDSITNGWDEGQMIVVGARPSQGKTALALNMALTAAKAGKGVAFFSLEMSRSQLTDRMISIESGVSYERIQKGTLTPQEVQIVNKAASRIAALPVYFDDRAGLSHRQVKTRVRKLKAKFGIKIAIVDYLQLVTVPGGKSRESREQQVAEVSRELKGTAKEYKIPFIVLAQLNRDADGNKPKPSNLRESGAIEQDADIIMFIWHEESTGQKRNWLVVTKNRNGKCEDVEVKFVGEFQKWTDLQDEQFAGYEPFTPYTDAITNFNHKQWEEDPF